MRRSRPTSGCDPNRRRRYLKGELLETRLMLHAAADSPTGQEAWERFNLASALFVENQGQWTDDSIRFLHQGDGANVAMTDTGPVFQVFRSLASDTDDAAKEEPLHSSALDRPREPQPREMRQFAVNFINAQLTTPAGWDQVETTFNYQVGAEQNWRSAVPSYEKIVYEELYPGIALHTWGQRSNLKYEFHVEPGVDWTDIQLSYEGIEGLSIADDGSLIVNLGDDWEELRDAAPYVYQDINGERTEIASRYVLLDGSTYTFALGDYDANYPLVIDPELAWGSYLGGGVGGNLNDAGYDVAVDPWGNVLVTGETVTTGWVSGGYDTSYNGSVFDAFVVKLSAAGEHLWSTYLGGTSVDQGYGIAVDSFGNVLVAGRTYSVGWVSGGYDTAHDGSFADAFVAKLSPAGEHLWSTYLGGARWDQGHGIAVDRLGNVLVTGETDSIDWVSGGNDTSYNGGQYDAFVAKLSAAGGHLWSTYVGGTGIDRGNGIAVDGLGNVLVTGETLSSGWMSGGYDTTFGGGSGDGFVVKLGAAGEHLWSTYLGVSDHDHGNGIAVDVSGNVLVTGVTGSSGWVSGGYNTTLSGNYDAFVVKLNAAGEHLWSTYLGPGLSTAARGDIAVDPLNNVLVTGETRAPGWASGGPDTTHNGMIDAFVVKLSAAGAHLWSTYLGGTGDDAGHGIAVDESGNVLIAGETESSGWLWDGHDTTYNGGWDAFVVKIDDPTPPTFQVMGFAPTATGVALDFSRDLNPGNLNLFNLADGSLGPADITLVGATSGAVRGSVVVDPGLRRLTFVSTTGTLAADTYTLTLRSAANGFTDASGALLDGDSNQTAGGDFVHAFTVAAPPAGAVRVSLPNIARGPGQPVNVPANSTTGLPISFSDGGGIVSASFDLRYDPALLNVTGASVAPGLAGATVNMQTIAPGALRLTFTSPTPLPAGTTRFVDLQTMVPDIAPYRNKTVLDLANVVLNGGSVAAVDDDAVQVVAYLGDTTANGTYSGSDASRIARLAAAAEVGLEEFLLLDPQIMADITGFGGISGSDTSRVLQAATGIGSAEIPLPLPTVSLVEGGPDPKLSLPTDLTAVPGASLIIPVHLDSILDLTGNGVESAELVIYYDATVLDVSAVRLGSLLTTATGWTMATRIDALAGRVLLSISSPTSLEGVFDGELVQLQAMVKPTAPLGPTALNLAASARDPGVQTQLNEGYLTLIPAPTDRADDAGVDGVLTIVAAADAVPAHQPSATLVSGRLLITLIDRQDRAIVWRLGPDLIRVRSNERVLGDFPPVQRLLLHGFIPGDRLIVDPALLAPKTTTASAEDLALLQLLDEHESFAKRGGRSVSGAGPLPRADH